ncbi:hypothetical protein LCGC14_3000450, partial [marine sediment metagenome]
GGSTIDAAKASTVLAALADGAHDVEPWFGAGKVTDALLAAGRKLPAFVAVQTAAGSAAHLTKYSNITDPQTAQKKLIIDEAVVPARAVFDYDLTCTASAELTLDGAFDGISHILETYYGAADETVDRLEAIAKAGVELIVGAVAAAAKAPDDRAAREGLGLGTDLGGYAIMVGGTNGPHLNSFSFVDVLAHGRACAILLPYYTVLFAPAIQRQLRVLGDVYHRRGLMRTDPADLAGRDLGVAVAEGMMALSRAVGFPVTLGEVPGFTDEHVARALGPEDTELAEQTGTDLVDTMRANQGCVGIAAPQLNELVRMLVVDLSEHPRATTNNGLLVLVNPHIVTSSGAEVGREGCLSIPDLTANVRRA